jgi:hypothetical protein
MRGGAPLDDDGCARALHPELTVRFAEYLTTLTRDELARRFDPSRMATMETHTRSFWNRDATDDHDPLKWLLTDFEELRGFIHRAAAAGDGVIVSMR